MIHFYDSIVAKTLETIKEARDCADILCDLNRIEQAKANVNLCGGVSAAKQLDELDEKLRKKYDRIDAMLNFANTMLPPSPRVGNVLSESEAAISALTQDYYGILCDAALKKEIVQGLKQFIKSVD